MQWESILFTPPNDEWLKAQVESQEFSSESDVVNDLILRAREVEAIRARLINAEQPLTHHPAVDEIRVGYRRSICGADSNCYCVTGDSSEVMAIFGQQDLDDWL